MLSFYRDHEDIYARLRWAAKAAIVSPSALPAEPGAEGLAHDLRLVGSRKPG
jgi:hypothetical protein